MCIRHLGASCGETEVEQRTQAVGPGEGIGKNSCPTSDMLENVSKYNLIINNLMILKQMK